MIKKYFYNIQIYIFIYTYFIYVTNRKAYSADCKNSRLKLINKIKEVEKQEVVPEIF